MITPAQWTIPRVTHQAVLAGLCSNSFHMCPTTCLISLCLLIDGVTWLSIPKKPDFSPGNFPVGWVWARGVRFGNINNLVTTQSGKSCYNIWEGGAPMVIPTNARGQRGQRGQGMTEYVIILVAIAIVCIAISVQFGGKIKALFETADSEIDTVDSGL